MIPEAATAPWTVAVPVKRSTFTPLRPEDAAYNVEVDLGSLGAFSNRGTPLAADEALYADLQLNADVNANRRLGSGRAGFYREGYIKGVGRTLLAGNWSNPEDLYHNSGLQLASAGARELLVSRYVEGLGLGRVIVPCTGLLIRELPPGFEDHLRNLYGPRPIDHGGVDSRLQVISRKPTDFGRLSNFVWWLCAFPQELERASALAEFFRRLYAALEPGDVDARSPSADAIAERFAQMARRGFDYFVAAWRAGVTWGSVSNNFTADGRFLDLETPCVLGGPQLGCQRNGFELDEPPPRIRVDVHGRYLGLEVARYLEQLRVFAEFMMHRLRFIATLRWITPLEAAFIEQFEERMRWHLRASFPLLDEHALREQLLAALNQTLQLGGRELELLGCMIGHALGGRRFLERAPSSAVMSAYRALELVRLELGALEPIEPGFRLELYVPEFLRERAGVNAEAAARFHEGLRAVARCVERDACLATLAAESERLSRLSPSA